MKHAKAIGCLLLTVLLTVAGLTFSAAPVFSAPEDASVLFVKDGGTGTGASADAALGSIVSAVQTLQKAGGGTLVVCGPVTIASNTVLGADDDRTVIRITSVYGKKDYRDDGATLVFGSSWKNISSKLAFVYENITFTMKGDNCSFYANGYPIVFGEGIKTVLAAGAGDDASMYPNVYGGSAFDLGATTHYPADNSVTVLSGAYNKILAVGKGSADKPRPNGDLSLCVGKDVVVKDRADFGGNSDTNAVQGKKMYVVNGEPNQAFSGAGADVTVKASGSGYVQGVSATNRTVKLCAASGYGAKIGGSFVENGPYTFEGASLTVSFERSDINRAAELAASRPQMPAAFPGEYIKGYDAGNGAFEFRPANNITIAEASTILVRLMTSEDEIRGQFKTEKAKASDWFYDNVAYLDTYGFYDDFDGFDGNRAITRAEFVRLVTLSKKLTKTAPEIAFTDVADGYKYKSAVVEASTAGLVNGYLEPDGTYTFRPENNITRAEVVTVVNRVFGVADVAPLRYKNMVPNFTDVPEDHWAVFQIIAAAGGREKPKEKIDLGGSGEVEYTVEGTVIFTSDKGDAGKDGKSYAAAVPYSKAIGLVPDGGTLVVCGPVTVSGNSYLGQSHTGTLLITSVCGGVDYRRTDDAAFILAKDWMNLVPGGDVILDNLAFVSRGNNCSIYADNHHLTVGRDLVCAIEDGGAYVSLYGGGAFDLSASRNFIGSESTASAHTGRYFGHLTVNGGTWADVYGGGKGSAEKPRRSDMAVVELGAGANVASVTASARNDAAKVEGLRVVILNGEPDVSLSPDAYDALVKVVGDGYAEAVTFDKANNSVTVHVTANGGQTIDGLGRDNTYVIDKEGMLSVTIEEESGAAVFGGKPREALIDESKIAFITDEQLAAIDETQAALTTAILEAQSTVKPAADGTAYYLSNAGSDDADGTSPSTAWATLERLAKAPLNPGDAVYFRRGDEWRNVQLRTVRGVSYSAYGEGAKPILNRSPFDGAKHGEWLSTDTPNVYVYSETFTNDVGSLAFNDRTFTDIYARKIVMLYDSSRRPVDAKGELLDNPLSLLSDDLSFWHDLGGPVVENGAGGKLYLRSDKGNPASRFTNIEFNIRGNTVSAASDVTIDNLNIRHAGSHGIGAGTVTNLKVTNCVLEWIGGSLQNYNGAGTRFGNAVEVYGGCDGYTVDHCLIDQVYDAGVTHQYSDASTGDCVEKNVTYSNNVILNCIYSIEHFNRAREGTTRYLTNIRYVGNICRFAGYGFGKTRPEGSMCGHIRSGRLVDTANFVIENNVFDRSTTNMFYLQPGGDEAIEWKNNTYVQFFGAKYGTIKGAGVLYDTKVQEAVNRGFAKPEFGGTYLYLKK